MLTFLCPQKMKKILLFLVTFLLICSCRNDDEFVDILSKNYDYCNEEIIEEVNGSGITSNVTKIKIYTESGKIVPNSNLSPGIYYLEITDVYGNVCFTEILLN